MPPQSIIGLLHLVFHFIIMKDYGKKEVMRDMMV